MKGEQTYSERPTEWSGKVELMYPSDYGYAVLASSCARTTNLSRYRSTSCAGNNWLKTGSYQRLAACLARTVMLFVHLSI